MVVWLMVHVRISLMDQSSMTKTTDKEVSKQKLYWDTHIVWGPDSNMIKYKRYNNYLNCELYEKQEKIGGKNWCL